MQDNVLVVGGGGREHAIVQALNHSPLVGKLYCAPGNAGIARHAERVPIKTDDISELLKFACQHDIGLTVVGPEAPLVNGIVDQFHAAGQRIFGPTAKAARLVEGSKVRCKQFLMKHNIPTAAFRCFRNPASAKDYVQKHGAPIVVKADGLCAGKGVVVARTVEEAQNAIHQMMVELIHGPAGAAVVVEDCLKGIEASYTVITDGTHVVPLVTARDYKTIFDHDRGPMTGGMGGYSPNDRITPQLERQILDSIVYPTVDKLANLPYTGVLYFGLMLTADGPKVLEINCRLGDPETQVILPRLQSDFFELIDAAATTDGGLTQVTPAWRTDAAVCVVLAAAGYPGKPRPGDVISGVETLERLGDETGDLFVYHAGTARDSKGNLVTAGGRVLAITALDKTIADARDRVYAVIEQCNVGFAGMQYRDDIAAGVS